MLVRVSLVYLAFNRTKYLNIVVRWYRSIVFTKTNWHQIIYNM